MLKLKISKEAHAKLSDDYKKLYGNETDDGFEIIGIELPDVGKLERALTRVKEEKITISEKLTATETELDELQGLDEKSRGDVTTLQKGFDRKFNQQQLDNEKASGLLTEQLSAKNKTIEQLMVDDAVDSIALELGGDKKNAAVLRPHLKGRIGVEFGEGSEAPVRRFFDAEGNASAMNRDDLMKEFRGNEIFDGNIKASVGTVKKGTPPKGAGDTIKPLNTYSQEEMIAHLDSVIATD